MRNPGARIWIFLVILLFWMNAPAQSYADSLSVLPASFTGKKIEIDGKAEPEWQRATPRIIRRAVTGDYSREVVDADVSGSVRALWDGAMVYLFIEVHDTVLNDRAKQQMHRDGVEVFLDLWNDKYPKYEEDDGMLFISAKGWRMLRGTDTARFAESATRVHYDERGFGTGYDIELAIHTHGVPPQNGSRIGLDIGIQDPATDGTSIRYHVYWNSIINNGLNDNSAWGTLVLEGYDGKANKQTDRFGLTRTLKQAEAWPRGIWTDESVLEQKIKQGKVALAQQEQLRIDQANDELIATLKDLRRKGPLPDPYDLPSITWLPDPFTFQDGKRVRSAAEWTQRVEEIKTLAQYYEYGRMPAKPQQVTATLRNDSLLVTVIDQGKQVQFVARLDLPADSQARQHARIPVILSIDFFPRKPEQAYLDAGYAVLGFRYTSVASDDRKHEGPFYELYPYDITRGQDAGTLLAWAWGASRCVDALEYLAAHDTRIGKLLDLDKIAITGFSRCGKAALAAGLFDQRFGLVSPGASGCGGAAVYRYVSFDSKPNRNGKFGNTYAWGSSPGCEVLGDKVRHQGHNANEMLARFLNPPRIYKTSHFGFGERLPYDHHEIIAAIAPRAVLITNATDDYANNAEGDAIGYEGAKPVFEFLGASGNLGLNLRTSGEKNPRGFPGGHWLSQDQVGNLITFAEFVFYQKPLTGKAATEFYNDPYLQAIDAYYGGLQTMMPWRSP